MMKNLKKKKKKSFNLKRPRNLLTIKIEDQEANLPRNPKREMKIVIVEAEVMKKKKLDLVKVLLLLMLIKLSQPSNYPKRFK